MIQKPLVNKLKGFSGHWMMWIAIALVVLITVGTVNLFMNVRSALASGEIFTGAELNAPLPPSSPPVTNVQPGQAVLHPIGISLAVLFVFLMITIFRWMFSVPPRLSYAVVKAQQSVSALSRILVPTTDDMISERAVELACRLGEDQKAEIVLTYIIEVPFTLSLDAPMPNEDVRGQEALNIAQAIVEQHGLPFKKKIVPHRSVWSGILQLAKEEMVDAIVMGTGRGKPGQSEGIGHNTQEILKRAECEVILNKSPR
jgi:nucleotide-binding universal stress UspA family protein